MLYLVIEILLFVILAGMLGLICGWFLRGGNVGRMKRSGTALQAEIDNKNEALFQVRSQLAAASALLREYAATDSDLDKDPRFLALQTGRYQRPQDANGAGKANGADDSPPSNGNGALPLGRRLGQARSLRPPRPGSRRTSWRGRARRLSTGSSAH